MNVADAQLMAQMSSPVLIHYATKTPNSSFTLHTDSKYTYYHTILLFFKWTIKCQNHSSNYRANKWLELLKNAQVQQVNNGIHKNADNAPSLQIVNPDNLIGYILNGKKRQRWWLMTNSPNTP